MAKDRDYLVSPKTTSLMFALSAIGMVAALVGLLLLASARPQGKFVNVDTSLQSQLLKTAEERLNGFHKNEDGSVAIPIDLAMDIVAERGFDEVLANANTGSSQSNANANAEVSGADVYTSNCASCHQANGAGIPGAFPPLAANVINLAKNNREYLPAAVINGLTGEINVNGQSFNGAMPAWKHLSDNEIAAVLNHITSNWDDAAGFKPYTAEEIAAVRAKTLNNNDIHKLRSQEATASETVASATTSDTTKQTSSAISTATDAVTSSNTNGDSVYSSNCVSCHQATGKGIPGAFPPLAGNAINHAKNIREYLPAVVLNGLTGQIDVDGQSYNGAMPAWKQLSDQDIADVLNHIVESWDDASGFKAYTAEEVAAIRSKKLSNDDIHNLRSQKPDDAAAANDVVTNATETKQAASTATEATTAETTTAISTASDTVSSTNTASTTTETTTKTATTETATTAAISTASESVAFANANAETVYTTNCASCHQATGKGIPGAFPPLAGNALNHAKNHREYLPAAVLNGLTGEIKVDGQSFNGAMPAWKQLSDKDIADVLNYIISKWDNASDIKPYSPAEIAEIRAKNLKTNDILELRSKTSSDEASASANKAKASAAVTTSGNSAATPTNFDWQEIGEAAYTNNCTACHQANGNGIPGAFPPLNKNAAHLYNANRDYLALAVLTGITGEIKVDGQTYNGAMPSWKQLSDEQIAGVLNHVLSSWDNPGIVKDFKAYTPDEIKEYRSKGLNSEEVLSLRP